MRLLDGVNPDVGVTLILPGLDAKATTTTTSDESGLGSTSTNSDSNPVVAGRVSEEELKGDRTWPVA